MGSSSERVKGRVYGWKKHASCDETYLAIVIFRGALRLLFIFESLYLFLEIAQAYARKSIVRIDKNSYTGFCRRRFSIATVLDITRSAGHCLRYTHRVAGDRDRVTSSEETRGAR